MAPHSRIQLYDSMPAFCAALGVALSDESDFTVHRLEDVHPRPMRSPLFRTNYYSVVLIRSGQGRYFVDDRVYATRPRTVYFTNPGHVKGFEIRRPQTGYVITFAESFLKQHGRLEVFEEFPFLVAEVAPPQHLGARSFAAFDDIAAQLIREAKAQSPYKHQVLGSLLVILLLRLKETFAPAFDSQADSNRGSAIVRAFRRHVEAHFRERAAGQVRPLLRVQDCAKLQGLHPSYLSTVLKSHTGKSAHAWIAAKTLAEAKAMLARSTGALKEITYTLGFRDVAHFSRFFKAHTGSTPSAFRARVQEARR